MKSPAFILTDSKRQLGHWTAGTRTLGISQLLLAQHSWGEVIEVLKHEMAHQFVHETLGTSDESAHGPTFRAVCAARNIDGRACGRPRSISLPSEVPKAVRRIRALLALADSPNEHEAHAAMRAAQRLMLRHNVVEFKERDCEAIHFVQVGPAKGRFDPWEKALAGLLSKHFAVQAIWVFVFDPTRGKRVRQLELIGTESNLAIASHVHAYLVRTSQQLWQHHKTLKQVKANRYRRDFLLGVVTGFGEKLDTGQRALQQEGLVLREDPEVGQWLRLRHPHIRSRRGRPVRNTPSLQEGRTAGRAIEIRPAITPDKRRVRALPWPRRSS